VARTVRAGGRAIGRLPFSYRGGDTPLCLVPAGLKFLALFVLSLAAFSSLPGLVVAALVTVTASLSARVKPWELLRGSRPLLVLSLFVLAFRTLDPGSPGIAAGAFGLCGLRLPPVAIPRVSAAGFGEGLLSGLRVMVSFAAGSLLFAVTTTRELRLSLGRAEAALTGLVARNRPVSAAPGAVSRIGLLLSLTLCFIPRFFEVWETIQLACDARSRKRGFRRLLLVIPLTAERMMEIAADTADALEARGLML
jgi:biotin transport system permease protein